MRVGRSSRIVLAIAVLALLATACSSDGPLERGADEPGGVDEPAELSVFDLRPGDCFLRPDEPKAKLGTVDAVPCRDAHDLEVFDLVTYDESDTFPGESELGTFADGECVTSFAGYVGEDYLDSELFVTYLLPTMESWTSDEGDDRTIVCLVTDPAAPRQTSAAATR